MVFKFCQNVYGSYSFLIFPWILWCPSSQEVELNFQPLEMGWTWWLTSNKEYCTSNGNPFQDLILWLPSFGVPSLSLSLSFSHHSLWQKPWQEHPYGEAHMVMNGNFQSQSSLQRLAMPTGLTTTSWKTLGQNHPVNILLNTWPSEAVWNNTSYFKQL